MLQAWDVVIVDGVDDSFHHEGVLLILERDVEEGKSVRLLVMLLLLPTSEKPMLIY